MSEDRFFFICGKAVIIGNKIIGVYVGESAAAGNGGHNMVNLLSSFIGS